MNVLTFNAGSSSIKYKVFAVDGADTTALLSGLIERIGENKGKWRHTFLDKTDESETFFPSHHEAFAALAEKLNHQLKDNPIQGVGHRVVHGGRDYFKPSIVTPEVLSAIKALSTFAPLHNPVNALGIECAMKDFPNALHIAIFDTGFHHSLPAYARQYAINHQIAEKYQIERYGFHGINHNYVALAAADHLNKPIEECSFISLHLGNGASACLIKKGESVDTSMGMTPLAGLIMGTRCGDIDPAIPLYLQKQGLEAEEIDTILNTQSGLRGLAKDNDMRHLLQRVDESDEEARLAIKMYVYAIQKLIGAYLSQTNALDALIFTGGIGENAVAIRQQVIEPLAHLNLHLDENLNTAAHAYNANCCPIQAKNTLPILVIRSDEEALMAQNVATIILSLFA